MRFFSTILITTILSLCPLSFAQEAAQPSPTQEDQSSASTDKTPDKPVKKKKAKGSTEDTDGADTAGERTVKITKKKKAEPDLKENDYEPMDENDILKTIDYPELQVVPRATERLHLEAQEERDNMFSPYWAIQAGAIANIVSGMNSAGKYLEDKDGVVTEKAKENNTIASQTSIAVGTIWLGVTWYANNRLGYLSANSTIRRVSGKDKKSEIFRERLAEEAFERPAKLAHFLKYAAVATNFVSAVYMDNSSGQDNPNYAAIAAITSLLPLFMDNRLEVNWEKHQEYKRKIYTPVMNWDFQYDQYARNIEPRFTLNWSF